MVEAKNKAMCRTVDTEGAARLIGRSSRSIVRDDDSGRMPRSIHIGSSRRWLVAELDAWLMYGCPLRDEWETIWADLRKAHPIGDVPTATATATV